MPVKIDVDFRRSQKSKFRLFLRWEDDAKNGNENEVMLTKN